MCTHDGYPTVDAARYLDDEVDSQVGRVFDGRYRLEACIGRGGMGAVYRAVQLSVDRPVALKILKSEYARNLDQVQRFQTEARAASQLEHPHTIRVYDFGHAGADGDGALYLVTELLEGEPLSDLIARSGAIEPERAVRIIAQVLKSVSEAHARGIIHRDIKPENIFLKRVHGEEEFVKVLDFGIAKVADTGGQKRVTTTGTVVGTPLYMSPEQARGRPMDHTTDLYSLGAVLWEMVTGEPPFTGENAMAVMMAHVQAPLPPMPGADTSRLRALESIIARCMAKDAAARPRSADALRRELNDWLGPDRPVSAEHDKPGIDASADPPAPVFEVPDGAAEGYEPDDLTLEAFGAVQGPRWGRWIVAAVLLAGVAGAALFGPDYFVADQPIRSAGPSGVGPGTVTGSPAAAAEPAVDAGSNPAALPSNGEPGGSLRRAAANPTALPRDEVVGASAVPHSGGMAGTNGVEPTTSSPRPKEERRPPRIRTERRPPERRRPTELRVEKK